MISVTDLRSHLADVVNANESLVRRGRLLSAVFLFGIDEHTFYITIREGRVVDIESGPRPLKDIAFSIRGSSQAWNEFWKPVPKAGFYDILGLAKLRHARIEGNVQVLLTHLRYIKELLAAPRGRLEASS